MNVPEAAAAAAVAAIDAAAVGAVSMCFDVFRWWHRSSSS